MQFLPRGVEHFAPLHLGQGVRRQPEGKKGKERVGWVGGVIESEIEAHVQNPRRVNSLGTMYNSSYAAFRVVSHRVQPVVRCVWVGRGWCWCFVCCIKKYVLTTDVEWRLCCTVSMLPRSPSIPLTEMALGQGLDVDIRDKKAQSVRKGRGFILNEGWGVSGRLMNADEDTSWGDPSYTIREASSRPNSALICTYRFAG